MLVRWAALNVSANGEDTKVKGMVISAGIGIGSPPRRV